MDERQRIIVMLEQLLPICDAWIEERDGESYFVDPNDGEEISAHYGATHMAATLILYGKMCGQMTMYHKGISLLNSILNRWEKSVTLQGFHFDFNNFALCVIADTIKDEDAALLQRIQQIVLHSGDSNHSTTNWLPMRWYVNQKRYEWSKDRKYKDRCKVCRKGVESATNVDGGIEDRMPKGISFNLQYDIATVGVIQFLRLRGVDYDLSRELNFLLHAVAPDGDINYQGRGTNQIFAWSLWFYLLASAGRTEDLKIALNFIEPKVLKMYKNHNLMLNNYDGADKYLWWDYHYCSVYCAHFLFWLVLAIRDNGQAEIDDCKENMPEDTGLHIFRTEEAFVATFDGRKEYLAERGPSVCAIWTKKYGMICKGTFGPWHGAFGNNYINDIALRNFCGVLEDNKICSFYERLLSKLKIHPFSKREIGFNKIDVKISNERIDLYFILNYNRKSVLNLPVTSTIIQKKDIGMKIDDVECNLVDLGTINTHYSASRLLQSYPLNGRICKITIY